MCIYGCALAASGVGEGAAQPYVIYVIYIYNIYINLYIVQIPNKETKVMKRGQNHICTHSVHTRMENLQKERYVYIYICMYIRKHTYTQRHTHTHARACHAPYKRKLLHTQPSQNTQPLISSFQRPPLERGELALASCWVPRLFSGLAVWPVFSHWTYYLLVVCCYRM